MKEFMKKFNALYGNTDRETILADNLDKAKKKGHARAVELKTILIQVTEYPIKTKE